jgi:hypothetical protein
VSLSLYMDVHVPGPISRALVARGVDVLTSQDDGTERWEDSPLLDRAAELRRVLFTRDQDFLIEVKRRQDLAADFFGVIYAHQLRVTIGRCIADLEVIALCGEAEDVRNRVAHLPLR